MSRSTWVHDEDCPACTDGVVLDLFVFADCEHGSSPSLLHWIDGRTYCESCSHRVIPAGSLKVGDELHITWGPRSEL